MEEGLRMKTKRFIQDLWVLLGREPQKPLASDFSEEAKRIHAEKWSDKKRFFELKKHVRDHAIKRHTWRNRRWAVLIFVNLLFVLSYRLDIQILEGSLTGSRFLGFHLIDLNAALQVMLAHKHIIANLIIGTSTIFLFWVLVGGRSFCSWVCPYHLLSELGEKAHLFLVKKKIIKGGVTFYRGTRTVLWVLFLVLSFVTGYTVYETISPTGILSRALIYGPGIALVWVGILLLFEIFVSRRAWCRYICPIGLTYGSLGGTITPVRVVYDLNKCFHEGDCRKVCLVPHALDFIQRDRATEVTLNTGADCTKCGMCVDTCPSGALKFEVKGLSKLM
jgi:ferredoxin-type protein NapH